MYSMAMHRLDSAVKTALCPRLTTRTRAAPTPTTSEVTIGVPVRGETLAEDAVERQRLLPAIEYIIREPEVWQASVQTQIAIMTSTSMMRPAVAPKTASTTYGRPTVARLPSVRLGAAISAAISSSAPPTPETTSARMIVRGVMRRGAWVSSDSSPAESKPTMT